MTAINTAPPMLVFGCLYVRGGARTMESKQLVLAADQPIPDMQLCYFFVSNDKSPLRLVVDSADLEPVLSVLGSHVTGEQLQEAPFEADTHCGVDEDDQRDDYEALVSRVHEYFGRGHLFVRTKRAHAHTHLHLLDAEPAFVPGASTPDGRKTVVVRCKCVGSYGGVQLRVHAVDIYTSSLRLASTAVRKDDIALDVVRSILGKCAATEDKSAPCTRVVLDFDGLVADHGDAKTRQQALADRSIVSMHTLANAIVSATQATFQPKLHRVESTSEPDLDPDTLTSYLHKYLVSRKVSKTMKLKVTTTWMHPHHRQLEDMVRVEVCKHTRAANRDQAARVSGACLFVLHIPATNMLAVIDAIRKCGVKSTKKDKLTRELLECCNTRHARTTEAYTVRDTTTFLLSGRCHTSPPFVSGITVSTAAGMEKLPGGNTVITFNKELMQKQQDSQLLLLAQQNKLKRARRIEETTEGTTKDDRFGRKRPKVETSPPADVTSPSDHYFSVCSDGESLKLEGVGQDKASEARANEITTFLGVLGKLRTHVQTIHQSYVDQPASFKAISDGVQKRWKDICDALPHSHTQQSGDRKQSAAERVVNSVLPELHSPPVGGKKEQQLRLQLHVVTCPEDAYRLATYKADWPQHATRHVLVNPTNSTNSQPVYLLVRTVKEAKTINCQMMELTEANVKTLVSLAADPSIFELNPHGFVHGYSDVLKINGRHLEDYWRLVYWVGVATQLLADTASPSSSAVPPPPTKVQPKVDRESLAKDYNVYAKGRDDSRITLVPHQRESEVQWNTAPVNTPIIDLRLDGRSGHSGWIVAKMSAEGGVVEDTNGVIKGVFQRFLSNSMNDRLTDMLTTLTGVSDAPWGRLMADEKVRERLKCEPFTTTTPDADKWTRMEQAVTLFDSDGLNDDVIQATPNKRKAIYERIFLVKRFCATRKLLLSGYVRDVQDSLALPDQELSSPNDALALLFWVNQRTVPDYLRFASSLLIQQWMSNLRLQIGELPDPMDPEDKYRFLQTMFSSIAHVKDVHHYNQRTIGDGDRKADKPQDVLWPATDKEDEYRRGLTTPVDAYVVFQNGLDKEARAYFPKSDITTPEDAFTTLEKKVAATTDKPAATQTTAYGNDVVSTFLYRLLPGLQPGPTKQSATVTFIPFLSFADAVDLRVARSLTDSHVADNVEVHMMDVLVEVAARMVSSNRDQYTDAVLACLKPLVFVAIRSYPDTSDLLPPSSAFCVLSFSEYEKLLKKLPNVEATAQPTPKPQQRHPLIYRIMQLPATLQFFPNGEWYKNYARLYALTKYVFTHVAGTALPEWFVNFKRCVYTDNAKGYNRPPFDLRLLRYDSFATASITVLSKQGDTFADTFKKAKESTYKHVSLYTAVDAIPTHISTKFSSIQRSAIMTNTYAGISTPWNRIISDLDTEFLNGKEPNVIVATTRGGVSEESSIKSFRYLRTYGTPVDDLAGFFSRFALVQSSVPMLLVPMMSKANRMSYVLNWYNMRMIASPSFKNVSSDVVDWNQEPSSNVIWNMLLRKEEKAIERPIVLLTAPSMMGVRGSETYAFLAGEGWQLSDWVDVVEMKEIEAAPVRVRLSRSSGTLKTLAQRSDRWAVIRSAVSFLDFVTPTPDDQGFVTKKNVKDAHAVLVQTVGLAVHLLEKKRSELARLVVEGVKQCSRYDRVRDITVVKNALTNIWNYGYRYRLAEVTKLAPADKKLVLEDVKCTATAMHQIMRIMFLQQVSFGVLTNNSTKKEIIEQTRERCLTMNAHAQRVANHNDREKEITAVANVISLLAELEKISDAKTAPKKLPTMDMEATIGTPQKFSPLNINIPAAAFTSLSEPLSIVWSSTTPTPTSTPEEIKAPSQRGSSLAPPVSLMSSKATAQTFSSLPAVKKDAQSDSSKPRDTPVVYDRLCDIADIVFHDLLVPDEFNVLS